MAQQFNSRRNNTMARNSFININDVKYDLLKIIEPWDGILEEGKSDPVYRLFVSYLNDLRKFGKIKDFTIKKHGQSIK